ncbi:MAG: hypothetical protein BJ554DRAFT_7933 [Olpidium bornovanus]|uniref:O-fucosyltransferase family protein n=1 Tax=Olpidium bornovanus TaxID=278681 RepID=A0A8H7ZV89_9FUNG|nr:MAG: hypothetical protein BJ554DRAFT_7933 [Olpidium bornovanus]
MRARPANLHAAPTKRPANRLRGASPFGPLSSARESGAGRCTAPGSCRRNSPPESPRRAAATKGPTASSDTAGAGTSPETAAGIPGCTTAPCCYRGAAGLALSGKRTRASATACPVCHAVLCLLLLPSLLYLFRVYAASASSPLSSSFLSAPAQTIAWPNRSASAPWRWARDLNFLSPRQRGPATVLVRHRRPWWAAGSEKPAPGSAPGEGQSRLLSSEEAGEVWPYSEAVDGAIDGRYDTEGSWGEHTANPTGVVAGLRLLVADRLGRNSSKQYAQPAEGDLSYNPHSQFNNQRSALQNALVIAQLLNRTLVVPRCYLGPDAVAPWVTSNHSFPLPDRLRLLDGNFTLNSSWNRNRGAGVVVPCQVLLDLDGPGVPYVDIEEFRRRFATWSPAVRASVVALRDHGRRQYRFTDMSEAQLREDAEAVQQALQDGQFRELLPLRRLAALSPRKYPVLHFNSLYGINALHLTLPLTTKARAEVQRTLLLTNPFITRAADMTVERLGGRGSFICGHFRGAGRTFSARAESLSVSMVNILKLMAENKNPTGAPAVDGLDGEGLPRGENGGKSADQSGAPSNPATPAGEPRFSGTVSSRVERPFREVAKAARGNGRGRNSSTAGGRTLGRGDRGFPKAAALVSVEADGAFPGGSPSGLSKSEIFDGTARPRLYLATDVPPGDQVMENFRRGFRASGVRFWTLADVVNVIRPVLGGWWRHSAGRNAFSPEVDALRLLSFLDSPDAEPGGRGEGWEEEEAEEDAADGGPRRRRESVEEQLVPFAYPFVEQLVCSRARYFVGTSGSTFSEFVVSEMTAAGLGGQAVMAVPSDAPVPGS